VLNVTWRRKVAGVEAGRGKPRGNLWSAFSSTRDVSKVTKAGFGGNHGVSLQNKKDTRARALRDGDSITDASEASTKAPALESGRYRAQAPAPFEKLETAAASVS
jgi:hypothetical protein